MVDDFGDLSLGNFALGKFNAVAEQVAGAIVAALAAENESYVARGALYDEETRCHGVAIDVTIFETA